MKFVDAAARGVRIVSGALVGLLLVVALAVPLPAVAQGVERVAGAVESIEGDTVLLIGGASFGLSQATNISLTRPATAADLQPGHYVAVTAVRMLDGGLSASIVSVFPEFQRGVGEGQFPLEGGENLMTNATIDALSGAELTVSYLGETTTVRLTADTRVVLRSVGSRADIRPGANVVANVLDGVARTVSIQ